jgi:ADP-ribose pyrophosphatase
MKEEKIRTIGALWARSFHVELDEVGRAGGLSRRLVVRHPSAVTVIPVFEDGRTLVVAQHRYPLDQETLEFPAGKIDPGESPEDAAFRELAEETGLRAGRLTKLTAFAPSVGYSDEMIHIFTAHDLTPTGRPLDEQEINRVERVAFDDLRAMILAGRLIDGTTIAALAAYDWSRNAV